MRLKYQKDMSPELRSNYEKQFTSDYTKAKQETTEDLNFRLGGIRATRGSSGFQFVGYRTLEQFYRGDQWDHDEPPGASQRTENYCAVIVDNFSSLLFDSPAEIHCSPADEVDDLLVIKAEMKEKLLQKVYDDNDADEIVFPNCSKCGSLYGDSFLLGPFLDKNGSEKKEDWKIVFFNADNPANIRILFSDKNYVDVEGFIDTTAISANKMITLYGELLEKRGIDVQKLVAKAVKRTSTNLSTGAQGTAIPMMNIDRYWTAEDMGIFVEGEFLALYHHGHGFVPIQKIKNIYVPNHPYGKSDIEDVIDPQMAHTQTKNDLANALRFLSTINLKGKNLDGIEVLVHGLSKIFNLPEDGELDPIQRSGDPYASSNNVSDNRRAILDVSGVSEALLATVNNNNISGRALSVALQSVIRKLNPRIKQYQRALRNMNANILKLYEIYFPETKEIIMGDYTSKVSIISTLLRNIIDELNKLQAGVQSLTTTQTNLGIPQPKIEQKRIKADLADPILGPQIARQPGLLGAQMANPTGQQGTPGEGGGGLPSQPNQAGTNVSPEGAVVAANQRASGAAPVPQLTTAPSVNP